MISKLLVANRGEIAVRSTPGQGTTFSITLPRDRLPAVTPEGPDDG